MNENKLLFLSEDSAVTITEGVMNAEQFVSHE